MPNRNLKPSLKIYRNALLENTSKLSIIKDSERQKQEHISIKSHPHFRITTEVMGVTPLVNIQNSQEYTFSDDFQELQPPRHFVEGVFIETGFY